jgi:hypothetical protein
MIDIPYNRITRAALVELGLAQSHHFLDDSGWITIYIKSDQDLVRIWFLSRLSWLQKRVRSAPTELEQTGLIELTSTLKLKPIRDNSSA